jgi:hypothetical protein
MGEITENVTSEAAGMAEDAVRYLMEGTIDNVEVTLPILTTAITSNSYKLTLVTGTAWLCLINAALQYSVANSQDV